MDVSENADLKREIKSQKIQIRYYKILALLVIVFFAIAAVYAIKNNRAIKAQDQLFHAANISNLKQIESNQAIQTQSIKQSFICIVNLPTGDINTKADAIACLSQVPEVMK